MAENLVNRNDLLAGVRQALGKFAASIPDHEIFNFGEQFKLSRADRYWVVHVTLEGLCESRTSQLMYRTANAGENFFPSIDVNNFNDWSVSFNDDNIRVLFGNGGFPSPVFHDINGSFATYSCSDCGGQGQFQCDRCVGGIDECYTCRGGGRFGTCLECYGHGGFSIHPQYGKSTYSSPYPPSSLWRYQQCLACNASGNGVCKTCNGRGQTRCIRCKGTLVANCRKCKGTGVVVEFIRLTREFGLQKSEGIYIPVGLLNSCKDQINSSNDWRRVANGTLNSSQSIPKPWQEVQRLVGDLAASIGNCVCLRYTFNGLPVYHLEGQIEGLQASAWIVGEEGTPLFVNDPFVKRCKQLIDMAVNEWNRGKQDQAVITLRRAVRMSKRWQPCNTVFELAKSIPQELLGKARTPQFVQETLDGLKSLGKWMFGGDKTSPDQSKSEKQDPSPVEHPKKIQWSF